MIRIIDFLVFYLTDLYNGNRKGTLLWSSSLRRTGFVVGLIITVWFCSIMELMLFFVGHISILDVPQLLGFSLAIVGLLSSQILKRIYITNKRYELITASSYKPFEWSKNLGVAICFITLAMGFILMFGSAVMIKVLSN